MFCPKCGNETKEGTLFCGNCGHKFSTENPTDVQQEAFVAEQNEQSREEISAENKQTFEETTAEGIPVHEEDNEFELYNLLRKWGIALFIIMGVFAFVPMFIDFWDSIGGQAMDELGLGSSDSLYISAYDMFKETSSYLTVIMIMFVVACFLSAVICFINGNTPRGSKKFIFPSIVSFFAPVMMIITYFVSVSETEYQTIFILLVPIVASVSSLVVCSWLCQLADGAEL